MFEWIRSCHENGNNMAEGYCIRARETFPWKFKYPYKYTPAQRQRRIMPDVACTYNDLYYKPACQALLKRVGGDKASMRRQLARDAACRKKRK